MPNATGIHSWTDELLNMPAWGLDNKQTPLDNDDREAAILAFQTPLDRHVKVRHSPKLKSTDEW